MFVPPVPQAIFVVGDIAISGREDEYKESGVILDGLVDTLGLQRSDVFLVPGNHDVDRNTCKGGMNRSYLQALRER